MEARRAMIFAAYLGGLCLNAGVVVGHSVAYTISNRTRTPHGISCTMALPYTILLNRQVKPERLKALAEVALKSRATADLALDRRSRFLPVPRSLKEIGITRRRSGEMVEECLMRHPRPWRGRGSTACTRLGPSYRAFRAGER
jgi:alcohol dehydrogenase class IV